VFTGTTFTDTASFSAFVQSCGKHITVGSANKINFDIAHGAESIFFFLGCMQAGSYGIPVGAIGE